MPMQGVEFLYPSVGYGVILGMGFFFTLFMLGLSFIQNRYTGFKTNSAEEFASASRSVKPGLVASGIVSAWTWAATLLTSTSKAYTLGVSGPYAYAAGATVQLFAFAMNSSMLKKHAPYARTFLEPIRVRWGTPGHLIGLFFALATNFLVSSMLITGASDTFADITGVNRIAVCFVLVIPVFCYVVVGGMRATLMCDYIHTSVLFSLILVFMLITYATSSQLGSFEKVYDLLVQAGKESPVDGNAQGSYVTMHSRSGLIFGVINLVGNFATVFNDQAYWQRAIASKPVSCVKAFILAGASWFSIPFGFATTLGLAGVALRTLTPDTFPKLSTALVTAGLPAAATAGTLMGAGGAAACLVILFLAVTSAASAELIAIASLFVYDIYVPYFNPTPTESQLLWWDHLFVFFAGILMAICGLIFHFIDIGMGWLYEFMGVVLGAGVPVMALCIMWNKANKWGCIAGGISGCALAIMAWLVSAAKLNGNVLSADTLGQDYPFLVGNLTSIGVSLIICVTTSLIWPEHYDWEGTRKLNAPFPAYEREVFGEAEKEHKDPVDLLEADKDQTETTQVQVDAHEGDPTFDMHLSYHPHLTLPRPHPDVNAVTASPEEEYDENLDPAKLQRSFMIATIITICVAGAFLFAIPLPLFFTQHIFPLRGFTAWVIISLIWVFVGLFLVVLYPIYESRHAIFTLVKGVLRDCGLGGKSAPAEEEPAIEKVPSAPVSIDNAA